MITLTGFILFRIDWFGRFDDFASLVTAVAVVYCLCHVASVVEKIYLLLAVGRRRTPTLETLRLFAVSFLLLNSTVNFFVYLFLKRFRKALRTLVWRCM